MKKSDVKKIIEKACFAHDLLSKCDSLEDLKSFCADDKYLSVRCSISESKDYTTFLMVRDFVLEGVLESIMRECAVLI